MKSVRGFVSTSLKAQSVLRTSIRCYAVPSQTAAIRFHKNAHPSTPGTLVKENVALPTLGASEVLVKMLAAPINPADLNMIEGGYGIKPKLPAIAGNEGVGIVEQVGANVTNVKVGSWVIPAKPGFGTWRTYAVANENDVDVIPNDIPVEYAATLAVNPCTALRLLEDFASLKAGDVIVQNGATSMVGHAVIQIAKARGIKTINIIRARPNQADMVERLKLLGGDVVVTEDYAVTPAMAELISDLPKPKLAFNAVGGQAVATLAKILDENSTIVSYGGMSRKPVTIGTSALIFKNITLKGFWLSKWLEQHSKEERAAMFNTIIPMIRSKKLVLFSERFDFNDFSSALEESQKEFKNRKVVLKMN